MRKHDWLGAVLMPLLAIVLLALFGLMVWTAIIAAFLLLVSAVIVFVVKRLLRRPAELPSEHVPETSGMLLEWLAPIYDWCCLIVGINPSFRDMILRYAALKPCEHVLDVGCGTGVLTRLAADAVGPAGRAVGIDPGQKMIGIARENAVNEGNPAEFRLAAVENLPFNDDSFDCVLSSFMVHHLPPDLKLKGLSEVYRVLKPGGRLLVVDIDRPVNPFWWLPVWPLLFSSFTKDQIRGRLGEYLRHAGFSGVVKLGHWKGFFGGWLAYK